MSVMNLFLAPSAAHVFTDAGVFDMRDVKLRGITNKVAALTRFNGVVAATGLHCITVMIDGFLTDKPYASLDELADNFGSYCREAVRLYNQSMDLSPAARAKAPKSWGEFEAILAGWSEAKVSPVGVLVRGYANGGIPAFTATPVTRYRGPDHPSFITHVFDPDNAAESGLELMRAQRAMKFAVRGAPRAQSKGSFFLEEPKQYLVASGFAQHTRVDRDGITMRVLERWDDKFEPMAA